MCIAIFNCNGASTLCLCHLIGQYSDHNNRNIIFLEVQNLIDDEDECDPTATEGFNMNITAKTLKILSEPCKLNDPENKRNLVVCFLKLWLLSYDHLFFH